MTKTRGLYLNILLVVYVLLIALTLFGLVSSLSKALALMSTIELTVNFLRNIALVVSIVGIFFWKKLAIYLFAALTIFEIISIFIASMAFDIINIITGVVLPALLLFAVYHKRAFFK